MDRAFDDDVRTVRKTSAILLGVAYRRARIERSTDKQHRHVGPQRRTKLISEIRRLPLLTNLRKRKVEDVFQQRALRLARDPLATRRSLSRSTVHHVRHRRANL